MKEISDEDILLQRLTKCFYTGCHNILLHPDEISLMTWDWQQKFLDGTVNTKLIHKYPISRTFTRLFLKSIISHLEGFQEVHDDFYSNLCLLMNNSGREDRFSHKHYLINNEDQIITIKETNKIVVNGTTGMRTWEAALMLADWALCHKEVFTNKHILELGSGVGFTGITIGKLCKPESMYLTDCHPEVLRAICDNIRINFPQTLESESNGQTLFKNERRTLGVMPLDWNSMEDLSNEIVPDVVIGADIVYDPLILEPLCDVIKKLFDRNDKLEVYIASVIRNEDTFKNFTKNLDSMNFEYQKLHQNENVFIDWDHTIEKCILKIKCNV